MRKYQRLKSETKRMVRGCGGGTGKKKDPTGFNGLMDAQNAKHLFHYSVRSKWISHKINITSESNNKKYPFMCSPFILN